MAGGPLPAESLSAGPGWVGWAAEPISSAARRRSSRLAQRDSAAARAARALCSPAERSSSTAASASSLAAVASLSCDCTCHGRKMLVSSSWKTLAGGLTMTAPDHSLLSACVTPGGFSRTRNKCTGVQVAPPCQAPPRGASCSAGHLEAGAARARPDAWLWRPPPGQHPGPPGALPAWTWPPAPGHLPPSPSHLQRTAYIPSCAWHLGHQLEDACQIRCWFQALCACRKGTMPVMAA